MTEIDLEIVNKSIEDLMKLGMIERDSGSAVKRSKARFKKAFEVRKHHTYYKLSREGELFVRKIDGRWLKRFFDDLIGKGAFKLLKTLKDSKDFKEACRLCGIDYDRYYEDFVLYRLITPSGRKTRLFQLLVMFAEL
jgi:predicted transcriptional regulator